MQKILPQTQREEPNGIEYEESVQLEAIDLIKSVIGSEYTKEEFALACEAIIASNEALKRERDYWNGINNQVKHYTPVEAWKEEIRNKFRSIPNLQTSEEWKSKVSEIMKYFIGEGTLDKNKGLLLIGEVGCGKTTIMNIFKHNPKNCYAVKSSREIASLYASEGHGVVSKYSKPLVQTFPEMFWGQTSLGLCLDDMGTESIKKNYGNGLNVVEELVLNWYDSRKFNMLHATTNLGYDDLKEAYGVRVVDRLTEMMNVIKFSAKETSKRK